MPRHDSDGSRESPRGARRARSSALLVILLAVGLLAWVPRGGVEGDRHRYAEEGAGWFSRDLDGLYHARRVERALREGEVAAVDPWMDYPRGAPIPWPPYYDLVLARALAPFAPAVGEEGRWLWIERATGSAPMLFGIAAALVATLAGWRLGGPIGAAVAGGTAALCRGSIIYSLAGNGDHHAWVALLDALALLLASEALRRGRLASRWAGAGFGAALGLVCGLMVGSWVAAILYVINLQLVLAWMLHRRAREPLPGVATLGLAMHVVAAVVLFPAVWDSPWRHDFPWMVVNLSWFHPAELVLGALVFVPLLLSGRRRLAAGTSAARFYPLTVAASLGGLALLTWALDLGPARGVAEGFAWVSRVDSFMGIVTESLPLVGARAGEGVLYYALGYSVLALPVALAFAAWRAFRQGRDTLLPWVVAVATLGPQALIQRRFADGLVVPMAVVLGWGAAELARRLAPRLPAALRVPAAAALVALALAGQLPGFGPTWRDLTGSGRIDPEVDPILAERQALEWIRGREVEAEGPGAVLSHWDRGHQIEWVARRPSVANNFGSYIGIDSYRTPPRFFLEESPRRAEEMLAERAVRYVYVPVDVIVLTRSMCRVVGAAACARYVRRPGAGSGTWPVSPRWFATMAGRLLVGGAPVELGGATVGDHPRPLGFLRLVHVTRQHAVGATGPVTGRPFPLGQVWERVAGAVVEAPGAIGDVLAIDLAVEYPDADYRLPWSARAPVGPDGVARLRVPYATDALNGDGRVVAARWRLGGAGGALEVPAGAVEAGGTVRLR